MAWKNQQDRRKNTPKASDVHKYWAQQKLPDVKSNPLIYLEKNTCFACGIFNNLQRAHIIPICDGGSNTVDNIHLLCKGCHSLSEGNKKYWNWLTYMRAHEWKFQWEWAVKILQMNGVDIDEEAEKTQNMTWEDRFLYITKLLSDNGIHVTYADKDYG